MSDSYNRICLLLAAAGYGERELQEFARSFERTGPSRFIHDVSERRAMVRSLSRSLKGDESFSARVPRISQSLDNTLAEKVTQLLVMEGGMTRSQAANALRVKIAEVGHPMPPPIGRRSFSDWVGQLLRVHSSSEILHLSTLIRNERVHQHETDWLLK